MILINLFPTSIQIGVIKDKIKIIKRCEEKTGDSKNSLSHGPFRIKIIMKTLKTKLEV